MATVIELLRKARELNIKGYSRLKKSALEEAIYSELMQRENAKLAAIRQADAPDFEKIPLGPFIPTQPFYLETNPNVSSGPTRRGLTNRQRMSRYLAQTPGRVRLTPAMARRMHKKYRAGDLSVSAAALIPGVNILPYL